MSLDSTNSLVRLGGWSIVCSAVALPSFLWAGLDDFCLSAMGMGVMLFILALTAITGTEWFARFQRRPFVSSTLRVGVSVRVVASLLIPLGMAGDVIPGLVSIGIVERAGIDEYSFLGTLMITLTQGAILSLLLFLFMILVWGWQRLYLEMPANPLICPECGYDLRGNPDAGCPECGWNRPPLATGPTP